MHKKSFILVSAILFVLFILTSFVSANDEVKNAVSNVTDTIIDGAERLGSDVRNGVGAAENAVEDTLDMDNQNNQDDIHIDDDNMGTARDYTATRTATDNLTTNDTATMWMWLILAIAAVVIIGLVWYYGVQNDRHDD